MMVGWIGSGRRFRWVGSVEPPESDRQPRSAGRCVPRCSAYRERRRSRRGFADGRAEPQCGGVGICAGRRTPAMSSRCRYQGLRAAGVRRGSGVPGRPRSVRRRSRSAAPPGPTGRAAVSSMYTLPRGISVVVRSREGPATRPPRAARAAEGESLGLGHSLSTASSCDTVGTPRMPSGVQ